MTIRAATLTDRPPLRAPTATVAESTGRLEGTTLLFAVYVFLILEQYIGIGQEFPLLMATKIPTLLNFAAFGVILWRIGFKQTLTEYPQNRMLTLFVAWTCFSIIWAIVQREVPEIARYHIGYLGFFALTLYLIDSRERMDKLAVIFTGIAILATLRNLDKFGAERGTIGFVGAFFMTDGNDFGWAMASLLPFPIHLMLGHRRLVTRAFGLAGLGAVLIGVMATESRGATLAVGAAMLYWLLIARRKVIGAVLLGAAVMVGGAMASSHYMNRLETIVDYQEDDSATQRIRAWKSAIQMANGYPLGVGANNFSAAYGMYYMPADTSGFMAYRWMSAHSVYFKMLGEYGWGGLLLLLATIGTSLRDNHRSGRTIRKDPEKYQVSSEWPFALNIGFLAYAVGAIFLGGLSYPHLYLFCGLTAGTRRVMAMDESTKDQAATPAPAPAPRVLPVRTLRRPGPATGRVLPRVPR